MTDMGDAPNLSGQHRQPVDPTVPIHVWLENSLAPNPLGCKPSFFSERFLNISM